MSQDESESPSPTSPGGLTYSASGVDLERARQAKVRIKELARSTFNSQVVQDIGAFAGLFRPDFSGIRKPVLASSADGVGTKLKIAFMTGIHNTIGIDLVSHCVNDLIALRARPLFFLDYIAAGRLEPAIAAQIVEGLASGCREAGCVLLGGETAEMPDFYAEGEYDLAGFIVGVADEDRLFAPERLQEGDLLLGLASTGLHTNGFSLVRRLFFKRLQLTPESFVADFQRTVGEELLTPHRNYLPIIEKVLDHDALQGIAHITGGGLTENVDRILPPGLDAVIDRETWKVPPVFQFIKGRGRVDQDEMFRTFNMGIGLVLAASHDRVGEIEKELHSQECRWWRIGQLRAGSGKVVYQ